jgi:hypothetical protein
MCFLVGYKHTPGHAVWKFVFGEIPYYRNTNGDAVRYFYDNQTQIFSIYVRSQDGGWKWIADCNKSDKCRCGRLYTDTFNGLEFRWRDSLLKPIKTIEDCIAVFQTPVLCQICHYTNEYNAGRWCPKWVKEQIS